MDPELTGKGKRNADPAELVAKRKTERSTKGLLPQGQREKEVRTCGPLGRKTTKREIKSNLGEPRVPKEEIISFQRNSLWEGQAG